MIILLSAFPSHRGPPRHFRIDDIPWGSRCSASRSLQIMCLHVAYDCRTAVTNTTAGLLVVNVLALLFCFALLVSALVLVKVCLIVSSLCFSQCLWVKYPPLHCCSRYNLHHHFCIGCSIANLVSGGIFSHHKKGVVPSIKRRVTTVAVRNPNCLLMSP